MAGILEGGKSSGSSTEEVEPEAMRLDPAVVEVLSVKPSQCKIKPYGRAGFSIPSKITTTVNDVTKHYFIKTGLNGDMFESEHTSLTALHQAVPSICPVSIAHGKFRNLPGYFLLTEYLDVSDREGEAGSGLTLPQKLAKLHSTTAPIPEGQSQPISSPCYTHDIEESHGACDELGTWIEKIVVEVVPRLLENGTLGSQGGIQPVLVHGDLWSGNKARGKIGEKGLIEDVVFDPSCCYAHSEYELGIMRMFGGFSVGFFNEYHEMIPKTEPKDEYEDRIELYQLYHYLNHYALFGGGYRDNAMDNMKKLYAKYGSE